MRGTLWGNVDPLLSVVMVTWNGLHHLRRSLPALLGQSLPPEASFEILVVDNASTDGSRRYLEELAAREPRVRLLVNARNEGFAGPNNRGFAAARGRFVATLNNDTLPEPSWLAAMLDAAEAGERVGSVASKMVFAHDPGTIQSAGISLDRTGIAWDRLVGRPVGESERVPVEVFGASAGAALYRRDMLEELGGFDSRFFMYLEDVDLAWRARLAGWRAVYAPGAVVRHAHSASAKEGSPLKNWHLGRNKVWSIAKCYPSPGLQSYLPLIVAYDLGSLPYTMVTKRDLSPLLGRLAGLRGLRPVLAERGRLHRRYPQGWERTAAWMEGVKPPAAVFQRYQSLRRIVERKGG
ncbi:MAG TPA: glycosyltransferase family 2 protein [Chloroflexota bacterium]|nr:glycosyltransferase family 2 protein [Chloroflexota bacterium]